MQRRVVVPALFATAASGVAYALSRLRRGGAAGRRRVVRLRRRETSCETADAAGALDAAAEQQEYRCDCGQAFLVSGAGRHRVYWLPDASPSDPVLSATCPECDRPLPREPQTTDAPAR
jgi:hypothetical protein